MPVAYAEARVKQPPDERRTPFGARMLEIRRTKGLLLGDVARAAGITSGFLSLVETGKKSLPEDLVDRIVAGLDLSATDSADLHEAAKLSTREYRVKMEIGAPATDHRLVSALQTGLAKMSPATKERILKLLEES